MTASRGIRGQRNQIRVRILLALHFLEEATMQEIAAHLNHKAAHFISIKINELYQDNRIYICDWKRVRITGKLSRVFAIKPHFNQPDMPKPVSDEKQLNQLRKARYKLARQLNIRNVYDRTSTESSSDIS